MCGDKTYNPTDYSGLGMVYLRKSSSSVSGNIWMIKNGADDIVYLMFRYNGVAYNIYDGNISKGLVLSNGIIKESSSYNVNNLPAAARSNSLLYTKNSSGNYEITLPDNTIVSDCILNQMELYYYSDLSNGRNILTQEMISDSNTIYFIQYDYDLNGETIEIPAGSVLEFVGGSINYGTIILNSNTVVRGNKTVCRASYNGLSHKSLFVASNVENLEIFDLTIKGNYDEDNDGELEIIGNRDAEALLFIGNSKNIYIEGLEISNFFNDNAGMNLGSKIVDKSKIGYAPIKIAACVDVYIEKCSEIKSAGEGWEFNFCNHITIDSLYIKRKYGVSSLNVEGCHGFSLLNSTFETGKSTGDIANILAQDALIDNCVFKGGGVDCGNEYANRNRFGDYDEIEAEIVNNVTYSNCYFGGDLRNGTHILDHSHDGGHTPDRVIDNLKVVNNRFHIDATKRDNIIAFYLGNNGNIGTVLFEGNQIDIDGVVDVGNDYYYQIIESFSSRLLPNQFIVDSLIIRGNTINDTTFTTLELYNNKVSQHNNGAIFVNNANSLVIENNVIRTCSGINSQADIYFPNQFHKEIIVRNNRMSFVCQKVILDFFFDPEIQESVYQKVGIFIFSGNVMDSISAEGYIAAIRIADKIIIKDNVINGVHGNFNISEVKKDITILNNSYSGTLTVTAPYNIVNHHSTVGTWSNRFAAPKKGMAFYDTDILCRPSWYNGTKWIDADGRTYPSAMYGSISNRPILDVITNDSGTGNPLYCADVGYKYMNFNAGNGVTKPIWWNGNKWVDADGAQSDVLRYGSWANRPSVAADIYEGFRYMLNDGTNHFPIYASITGDTITWYKADGTVFSI